MRPAITAPAMPTDPSRESCLARGPTERASLGRPIHSLTDREPPRDLLWVFQIQELGAGKSKLGKQVGTGISGKGGGVVPQ